MGERKRFKDATLLVLKTEEGSMSQGKQAASTGKDKRRILP